MDEKPIDGLNVIPFVDIMLVLLTIVLTTTNFIATGRIPVALPQSSQTQAEKKSDKTIEISASGSLYVDGDAVSKEELKSSLSDLPPETTFLIRADKTIQFQIFVDVADVLKQLKLPGSQSRPRRYRDSDPACRMDRPGDGAPST